MNIDSPGYVTVGEVWVIVRNFLNYNKVKIWRTVEFHNIKFGLSSDWNSRKDRLINAFTYELCMNMLLVIFHLWISEVVLKRFVLKIITKNLEKKTQLQTFPPIFIRRIWNLDDESSMITCQHYTSNCLVEWVLIRSNF